MNINGKFCSNWTLEIKVIQHVRVFLGQPLYFSVDKYKIERNYTLKIKVEMDKRLLVTDRTYDPADDLYYDIVV